MFLPPITAVSAAGYYPAPAAVMRKTHAIESNLFVFIIVVGVGANLTVEPNLPPDQLERHTDGTKEAYGDLEDSVHNIAAPSPA